MRKGSELYNSQSLEAKHGIKNHSEGWTLAAADIIRERRAARAEGPAPVSAPLDREGVAELREALDRLMRAERASAKAEREALVALRFESSDLLVKLAAQNEAGTEITASWEAARNALAKADAILALSQQDQVGLTTPAVLGEPSADALRSEGDDAVGAAERDVGRYIYQRIETLMDAKHVTGIANELTYLATIAEAVEEYGSEACGGEDLSVFQGPPPPAGGVK